MGHRMPLRDPSIRSLVTTAFASVFVIAFMGGLPTGFFPVVAETKFGLTPAWVGVVFCVFPATSAVVAPLSSLLCDRFGRLRVLLVGLLCNGVGAALFGFCRTIGPLVALRCVQGVGNSFAFVSSIAMLTGTVEDLTLAVSIQEAINGLGYIVAPPTGAAAYSLMGYEPAYLLNGGLCVTVMLFTCLSAHRDKSVWMKYDRPVPQSLEATEADIDNPLLGADLREQLAQLPRRFLFDGTVVSVAVSVFYLNMLLGTIEATLAPHISAWTNAPTWAVGLLFSLLASAYAVSAALSAKICYAIGRKGSVVLGYILVVSGLLLLGPIPPLDAITNTIIANWCLLPVSLVLVGGGCGCCLLPSLPLMRDGVATVRDRHSQYYSNPDALANFTSGVFSSASSLGLVTGLAISGLLVEFLPHRWLLGCNQSVVVCSTGYQHAMGVCAGVGAVVLLVVLIYVPSTKVAQEEVCNR